VTDQGASTTNDITVKGNSVNDHIISTSNPHNTGLSNLDNYATTDSLSVGGLSSSSIMQQGGKNVVDIGDSVTALSDVDSSGSGYIITTNERSRIVDQPVYDDLHDIKAQLDDLHTDGSPTFYGITLTGDGTFNEIIEGDGYQSGVLGQDWRIDPASSGGSLFEIDNIRVRHELRTHIFKKDIVKAANGYLYITDSAEVAQDVKVNSDGTTSLPNNVIRIIKGEGNATFNVNDTLWFKEAQDGGGAINSVQFDIASVYDTSNSDYDEYTIKNVVYSGDLLDGGTIARISGPTILNDASSTYAPFVEMREDANALRARIGNLYGSGYGGYSSNTYGAAFGNASGDHMTIDAVNGVRFIGSGGSIAAQFTSGSFSISSGSGIGNFSDAGSLAEQDSADWQSDVTGTGKPADNADVTGDNTAKDIVNLPDTVGGAGLYATGTYLGYSDGANWRSYMSANGEFVLKDSNGTQRMNFDAPGNTASIAGWNFDGDKFYNDTHIILDGTGKGIYINNTEFGEPGVQIEYNGGNPRFFVGDSTTYLEYDGSDVWFQARKFSLHDDNAGWSDVLIGGGNSSDNITAHLGSGAVFPDPENQFEKEIRGAGSFRRIINATVTDAVAVYAEARNDAYSGGNHAWAGYFHGKVETVGDVIATDFVLRS
jgi:hypothetical protein